MRYALFRSLKKKKRSYFFALVAACIAVIVYLRDNYSFIDDYWDEMLQKNFLEIRIASKVVISRLFRCKYCNGIKVKSYFQVFASIVMLLCS